MAQQIAFFVTDASGNAFTSSSTVLCNISQVDLTSGAAVSILTGATAGSVTGLRGIFNLNYTGSFDFATYYYAVTASASGALQAAQIFGNLAQSSVNILAVNGSTSASGALSMSTVDLDGFLKTSLYGFKDNLQAPPTFLSNLDDITAEVSFTVAGNDMLLLAQEAAANTIGGVNTVSVRFNDTNGALITAVPFRATLTSGLLQESHTASSFTTSLNDGAYGIAATAPGYQFTPTTLTVNSGATTFTETMIPLIHDNPTPIAGQVLAQGYARDAGGNILASQAVEYEMLIIPSGTGNGFSTGTLSTTSGPDGYFVFSAWTGSTLSVRIQTQAWKNSQVVPAVDFWLNNFD